ncbi:MAG: flagellar biosynthetic protein FliQ [Lachnospiraceae bacterium]|nr:flagellar biosynthetic protein FliQ [Lachnospiraceae bacterium]
MDEAVLIDLLVSTVVTIIKASAPLLIVSLVVGLVISILQTVTSIQEQTLTFVPKLLAVFLVLIIAGNWIMGLAVELMKELCMNFEYYIHG